MNHQFEYQGTPKGKNGDFVFIRVVLFLLLGFGILYLTIKFVQIKEAAKVAEKKTVEERSKSLINSTVAWSMLVDADMKFATPVIGTEGPFGPNMGGKKEAIAIYDKIVSEYPETLASKEAAKRLAGIYDKLIEQYSI